MIIDELTDALSVALDKYFNGCRVYTPEVEQKLEEPCFMITLVGAEKQPLLGARANLIYNFDVIYFPKSKEHTEMFGAADKMLAALKRITTLDGTQVNGWRQSYEVTDDALHFFVTYQLTVVELDGGADKMERYEQDIKVKEA